MFDKTIKLSIICKKSDEWSEILENNTFCPKIPCSRKYKKFTKINFDQMRKYSIRYKNNDKYSEAAEKKLFLLKI